MSDVLVKLDRHQVGQIMTGQGVRVRVNDKICAVLDFDNGVTVEGRRAQQLGETLIAGMRGILGK